MKINPYNPYFLQFTPVATASYQVNLGAAGWVDTDVSATTGTNSRRVWVLTCYPTAGGTYMGARATGGAVDNRSLVQSSITLLAKADAAGHMDLLRDVAQNLVYQFVGYLE